MCEIAASFADAGADILATNTFNANRISQADYGAEALVREINAASARIVREVAGPGRWVAGSRKERPMLAVPEGTKALPKVAF